MKLFNFDSPLGQLLTKITDLLLLNLCFLICCIPIFTIGASLTALYSVSLTQSNDSGILYRFFSAFKTNFQKSTVIWLIILCIGAFFILDMIVLSSLTIVGAEFVCIILQIGIFLLLEVSCLAFPLTAKYDNSVLQTLKNALIFSIVGVPFVLLMLLLGLSPLILWWFSADLFMASLVVWFFIGASLTAAINSRLLLFFFQKFQEPPINDTP